jgi:AraC-like DNA-binding protein
MTSDLRTFFLEPLSEVRRSGVKRVIVASEPGPIESEGNRIFVSSPRFIVCLEGRAHYIIRRNECPHEVQLGFGDILVLQTGTWVSVQPKAMYRSVGIIFSEHHTHTYMIAPDDSPAEPKSIAYRPVQDKTSPFRRMLLLAKLDHPALPTALCFSLLTCLAHAAEKSPEHPILQHLGSALLHESIQLLEAPLDGLPSKSRARFIAACMEIEQTWNRATNRDLVAQAIHIHPQYLTRLFKRHTGQTFGAYLEQYRLQRAAEMLESGMPVGEVADACGYTSSPYFITCFGKHFGHTPGVHRRNKALEQLH